MNLTKSTWILGLLVLVPLLATLALSPQAGPWAEAEKLLYSDDLNFAKASQALTIYQGLLPRAGEERFLLLTRLAQVCFILGDLAEEDQRRQFYEQGRRYAESLFEEQPQAVEGHYWLAMHLCGLADVGSAFAGRRLLPQILRELKRVLVLDETYDRAGAHRVLGRIYYEAPGWPFSVGDLDRSYRHLATAVRLAPETSTNHLYLGETLLRQDKPGQARREFEAVLRSSRHAIHPPGLEEDRQKARRYLNELGSTDK